MNSFEEPNKKPRRKSIESKKYKRQDMSEEQYAQNKKKKQFKFKKNELRGEELWDDWRSEDEDTGY